MSRHDKIKRLESLFSGNTRRLHQPQILYTYYNDNGLIRRFDGKHPEAIAEVVSDGITTRFKSNHPELKFITDPNAEVPLFIDDLATL